ncbi:MAG: RHS repeat protein, partial [Spirochaetes bacterium]|nr:RHS repeat protein [Spirochaetota bacterium]
MIEKIIEGINHTTYQYDIRGNLIERKQEETDVVTIYENNEAKQLTAIIDPNGNITEYGYNALGMVEWIKDSEENTKYIDYNANNKIISVTDFMGNETVYDYNEMNRLTRAIDPYNNEINYKYDVKGNLLRLTDKNENITHYEYNKLNQIIETIDPSGNYELSEYDPRGLIIGKTDKNGNKTVYEYDSLERLIKFINPLNGVVEYSYDALDNLLTQTDERENTTAYEYDKLQRVAKQIDAYGNEKSYEYNYLGQVNRETDALGNEKEYEYDELGRLTKEIDPLGEFKTYEYDNNSNLIKLEDELNRPKYYSYDSLNRLIKETNALEEEIQYKYDKNSNLIEEIDANGEVYKYEHDKLNRLIKEINRTENEQTYEYDANDNLIKKIDFNENSTVYEYDPLNRLIQTFFADGTKKEFDYDPTGNILRAENNINELKYEYDKLNRLIKANDIGKEEIISYKYDPAGNRTQMTWLDDARSVLYTYGKLNELLTIKDTEGKTTTYEYDPLGREIKKILPNDITTETTYDPAGRILTIKNTNNFNKGHDKKLKSFAYLYNAAGERTHQIEEDGNITTYEYDEICRIKNVYYPFNSGKKVEDFREKLYLGLYPDYEHGKGKKENDYYFNLPNVNIPEFDNKKFKDSLKGLLKDKEDVFKEYKKLDKKLKGKWKVEIGEGATEFASRLEVDYETEEAINNLYEQIKVKHGYLDTAQWIWTETFNYDLNSNRIAKANGWGKIDYSYNIDNEILKAGNRIYEHDLNGNLIKESLGGIDGIYNYNPENRATNIYSEISGFIGHKEWSLEAGVEYDYDALGRRNSRVEYLEKSK